MINYAHLPAHAIHTLYQYIERGVKPSEPYLHMLRNDFLRVLTSVDSRNLAQVQEIALWLYTEAPARSFGSDANVEYWMSVGGRIGMLARAEEARQHLTTPPPPYVRTLPRIHEPMD